MAELTVWGLVVMITLSEVIINTCNFIHGNSHGYIPQSNDARYLQIDPLHNGVRISKYEEDVFASSSLLSLTPRMLDFKDRPLGVPHQEKVTVLNTDSNKTIHLTSISGTTPHFHCSFFEDKVVPPLGNTSFSVVFLGREEGLAESMLFIHTSEGTVKFQVKGNSVSSPYRLRPLVGLQMPINASFSPLIHMHNPHPNPIQIMEIYSSGGEVNLELPTGELEAVKELWEIQPFETKAVIRAKFMANVQRNHTCYLRIRVNGTTEHLVVPFEVEVGSSAGLYPPEPAIDLGVLGSEYGPKRFPISLLNSSKKSAVIQSVYTEPATDAVKIEFESLKVPPDSKVATKIASITFYPDIAYKEKHFSGTIVVKGKNKIVIPYHVVVLPGGLNYNASFASFCLDEVIASRNLTVWNTFHYPVVISNVTLAADANKYFQISNFTAQAIKPGMNVTLFQLIPRSKSPIPKGFRLESSLEIVTNVSVISVPVLCYDGKIVKMIAERDRGEEEEPTLDLGLMATRSERSVEFILHNPNPVPIVIKAIGVEPVRGGDLETTLLLLGTGKTSHKDVMEQWFTSPMNLSSDNVIQSKGFAVFKCQILTGYEEGYFSGELVVKTKFETMLLPFRLKVSKGQLRLDPSEILFDDAFPGRKSVQRLVLHSEFQQHMRIVSLGGRDERLTFIKIADVGVKPFSSSTIGELLFDPQVTCPGVCYLGIDYDTQAGQRWLEGLSMQPSTWRSDLEILNTFYSRFRASGAMQWVNTTLRLDTTEVRGHLVPLSTRLIWPSLITCGKHIDFPLTQVGNSSKITLHLYNPSDSPLIVQLVIGDLYAPIDEIHQYLPEDLQPPNACGEDRGEFKVVKDEGEFENLQHSSLDWISNSDDENSFIGTKPHQDSVTFVLEPGAEYPAVVQYTPRDTHAASSLLYVKNNLTVVEIFRLSGQGAVAQFKFGNRKSGVSPPLQFDMPKKIEKECRKGVWSQNIIPMLSVKRSFTARNTGELPVYVSNFHINNLPCEGYGFKVSRCQPFLLPVNGSRKIELAFTPDFTLARVQRVLKISTSVGGVDGGVMNYTLVATVPADLLGPCSKTLPRPPWEKNIYMFITAFMLILLALIMAGALVEAERIHKLGLTSVSAALSKNRVTSNGVILPSPQSSLSSLAMSTSSISSSSSSSSSSSPTCQTTKITAEPIKTKNKEFDQEMDTAQPRHHDAKEVTKMSPQPAHVKVVRRKLSKKQSNSDVPDSSPENPPSPPPAKEIRRKGAWTDMFGRGAKSKELEAETKKIVQKVKRARACESATTSTTSGEGSPTPSLEEHYENKERLAIHRKNLNAASQKLDSYEQDTEEDNEEGKSVKGKTKQTKSSLEQPLEPLVNKKKLPLLLPEQPKKKKEKAPRGGTPMLFQPQPLTKSKKMTPVNYKVAETAEKMRPQTPPPPPRPASSPVETPACPSPLYSTVLSPLADSSLIDASMKKEIPGPIGSKCSAKYQPNGLNNHWSGTGEMSNTRLVMHDIFEPTSFRQQDNLAWSSMESQDSWTSLLADRRRRVEQHESRFAFSNGPSEGSWNNWSFDPPSLNTVTSPNSYSQPRSETESKSLWAYSGNATSAWNNTPAQPPPTPPVEFNLFESPTNLWSIPTQQQPQSPPQPQQPQTQSWFGSANHNNQG
ncbi:transmembrane protein 131 isoform X2 [Neocloeon triangulifer]|uniref:transmembrane protein 131 isoform X2 n=1 Tax=Neocloeon triangulifer TaxID=2078957 RepID=UPI00286F36DD|nr:transmembrane protein 131 isoform X2 [Neocloeon triangulifer]